tara:strand:+ start:2060 stop:2161 length:102 start_codon:yes stop_codon:yes gene_type:complete
MTVFLFEGRRKEQLFEAWKGKKLPSQKALKFAY